MKRKRNVKLLVIIVATIVLILLASGAIQLRIVFFDPHQGGGSLKVYNLTLKPSALSIGEHMWYQYPWGIAVFTLEVAGRSDVKEIITAIELKMTNTGGSWEANYVYPEVLLNGNLLFFDRGSGTQVFVGSDGRPLEVLCRDPVYGNIWGGIKGSCAPDSWTASTTWINTPEWGRTHPFCCSTLMFKASSTSIKPSYTVQTDRYGANVNIIKVNLKSPNSAPLVPNVGYSARVDSLKVYTVIR